jgi:hypothetical protein
MKNKLTIFCLFICLPSFGQSITLLPSNLTTQSSGNSHELQSSNQTVLKLRNTNPVGTLTDYLAFYKHDNSLLSKLSFGSQFAVFDINAISGIQFRIRNATDYELLIKQGGVQIRNSFEVNSLGYAGIIGGELRQVYVNEDGLFLTRSTSNQYASYNFSSVQAQNSSDLIVRGSGYAWFNSLSGSKTFYIPVNLPDGVNVSNVRMFIRDNSTSNMSFTFSKNSHLSNTFTTIATSQSSTNNTNLLSINANASETIDNQNNSYYVNISSGGDWTGNTLQFHSLVITYQNRF